VIGVAPDHPAVALAVVLLTMLGETALSRRNEQRLRAAGAVEPADDVYGWMQVVYPLGFAACIAERAWRGGAWGMVAGTGLAIFLAGKIIKYVAIATLGERWTFRVLPLPGRPLVHAGIYRWLRHPNYVGVMGEVVGIALWMQAAWSGTAFVLAFTWLLQARIRVEERALAASAAR
jgi:methyltransferase